ncbi:MAG: ABC transporter substrate-binding protein [Trueperaceae bacterium]|nr:MAG: ABC transporter substrate-binding protein [Trueperaceae bacterium]
MKRLIGFIFSAALLFTGSAFAQQVNLLCSPDLAWCEQIGPAFEEATGIDLEFVRLSSSESLARLRAEAANPTFDVWFGGTGDPHLVAFTEGITEFYKPTVWDDLLSGLKNAVGETYIPLYTGAIGFVVNEGILAEVGAPVPQCWEDLVDPVYKGLLAMPNPNTSGTSYTIIATLIQIFGEEQAFEMLAAIHQNVAQYTRSGGAVGLLAGRGDVGVAIQFMHDGVKYVRQGFPVINIAPCEGTGFEIGGISLIKGAPHPDDALAFIEWALTPEAQAIAAQRGESFQVQSNANTPVPPESPDLSSINLIDYDFATFGSPEVRDRIVAKWTNEVFPVPRR